MKKKQFIIIAFFSFLLIACSVEPKKINYGSEACHFCQMTIVDKQHASQYVTVKGKQFKFDAIECMLNDLSEKTIDNISILLVADYGNPETMTDAKNATYLMSEEIKSPMGAFLSAFSEEEKATKLILTDEDKIYTWLSIKEKYDVK